MSVAEWLRRQVVALEIVGSNPTVHPTTYCNHADTLLISGIPKLTAYHLEGSRSPSVDSVRRLN